MTIKPKRPRKYTPVNPDVLLRGLDPEVHAIIKAAARARDITMASYISACVRAVDKARTYGLPWLEEFDLQEVRG